MTSPSHMAMRTLTACILILILTAIAAVSPGQASETRELYRIQVLNRVGGPISVSADSGRTFVQVGRVQRPATRSAPGYLASVYAAHGTVAATAVHGIRIRVSDTGSVPGRPQVISILPREFAESPKGFGGHVAGASGICTDIPTGKAIFRNLSPFVGNPVFLQVTDRLITLPNGYIPQEGDTLVILVQIPSRYPREIILENKAGGLIQAVYPDGTETIARVERAVRGIGRFDATGYTGVGRINTNHTGVITISTAPIADGAKDGSAGETRGGFMIQPSRHAKTSPEEAQILVAAPVSKDAPWLEGAPPLFSSCIGPAYDPASEENSFRVDIRTSKSDWRRLPPLVGKRDDALTNLPGVGGSVTHIRIAFPKFSEDWIEAQLKACREAYVSSALEQARKKGAMVVSDVLTLVLNAEGLAGVRLVNLYVDGELRGTSNSPPYTFPLSAAKLPAGEHVAELRAVDEHGKVLKRLQRIFIVQGPEGP